MRNEKRKHSEDFKGEKTNNEQRNVDENQISSFFIYNPQKIQKRKRSIYKKNIRNKKKYTI